MIRRSSAPKADNTIGMYKRDGKGAYTTDEDHDCAEIHPDASHKQWAKKVSQNDENILLAPKSGPGKKAARALYRKEDSDDVQMTDTQQASDDAEKRRTADAKKRDAIRAARERLQQSTKAAREKLQQAKAAKVEEYDVTDESLVKDIVGQALRARTRRKEGERKAKAYQDSVKAKARANDTAGSLRATLKGTAWGRKPLHNGDDHDEEIEENQDSKEAKRKAEHSALVARLIAARGTKPKKTAFKHPKSTVHKIKYDAPHDPKYGPGGRYDTLTGKREEAEFNEWSSAKDRGEPQSPRSEDEYNALSPEHKKLIDARIKKARYATPEGRPRVKGKTPSRGRREEVEFDEAREAGYKMPQTHKGETYEVKYAKSKQGPIFVSKFQ
ncbi:TPA: hypothetical protein EYN23_12795, partial [Candidatus Poribacteria bacterium]|nr:hypothetical protein [Candidatus Poribacteria bacterium]